MTGKPDDGSQLGPVRVGDRLHAGLLIAPEAEQARNPRRPVRGRPPAHPRRAGPVAAGARQSKLGNAYQETSLPLAKHQTTPPGGTNSKPTELLLIISRAPSIGWLTMIPVL